ncbi:MAG TPA: 4Fe-4S dicluster domain-containing protein [Trebonia sp.]
MPAYMLERDGLDQLFGALRARGFRLVGPVLRDDAICYDDIESAADLPAGWTDEQAGGTYRVRRREDEALFGYNVGPQSWKKLLFPPSSRLWPPEEGPEKFAFIGVRACELHAIGIQDKVFMGGRHPDPLYAARREGAFILAVNCGQAGGTCFCVSMDSGPRATDGFDLSLTELTAGQRFLVETGTERGGEIAAELGWRPAVTAETSAARAVTDATAAAMSKAMPEVDLRGLLLDNLEHPRWDDVAARCLSCGNCTMVCPTCFCFSVEDTSSLTGEDPERHRSWDSCFTLDHSYLHGGPVRASTRFRYRQWMTHKLATWIDQFGTSGCVGCGRCVTWCPVGIDITEEVAAIAADSRTSDSPDASSWPTVDP